MAGKTAQRRGVFVGEVIANEPICDEHFRLRLTVEGFPPTDPGQFVQLQCRGLDEQMSLNVVEWPNDRPPVLTQSELTGREPLLRRPLSLAGRRDIHAGAAELEIIYRVIGTGTTWLSGVDASQRLSVLGPLGNAFRISPDKPLAGLVGGGVGIPPMIYLAEALAAAGKKVTAFSGARSANLVPLTLPAVGDGSAAEFASHGVESIIATDDGSVGFGGMVSDAFLHWLDECEVDSSELVVYCCGPEVMMRSVAEICIDRSIGCQLAMERHMACGMGTCQSCIVKVRDESESGWSFKLCCTDGPIFDAKDIVW